MALSSLPIWQEDMLLFVRERDARAYTTPAYFVARVLFDIVPLRVFPPLAFSLITYPAAGLHAESAVTVLAFTVTLVVANTVASLICMCLGAVLPSLTLSNMVRQPRLSLGTSSLAASRCLRRLLRVPPAHTCCTLMPSMLPAACQNAFWKPALLLSRLVRLLLPHLNCIRS